MLNLFKNIYLNFGKYFSLIRSSEWFSRFYSKMGKEDEIVTSTTTPAGNRKLLPYLTVLYESENFIVVNKLADLVINDYDKSRDSVENQLAERYSSLANESLGFRFYFTHRLDYSTSGILCIAKTKTACAAASTAFQLRKTKKFYLAILRGNLSTDYLLITERIGQDLFETHKMATESMPNCSKNQQSAETRLQVLERGICYDSPATKVLLRPITGRRHQLRLHCHHIGHTIVGDFTYSNKQDLSPHRMFLHAFKIEIDNSIENVVVTSPDPFLPTDPLNCWVPSETVKSISAALNEFD